MRQKIVNHATLVERKSYSRWIIAFLEVPFLFHVIRFESSTPLIGIGEDVNGVELADTILANALLRAHSIEPCPLGIGNLVASASYVVFPGLDLMTVSAFHLTIELDVATAS